MSVAFDLPRSPPITVATEKMMIRILAAIATMALAGCVSPDANSGN